MNTCLRIAIVEDSLIDQEILGSFVKEYLFEKDINNEINVFNCARRALETENEYDLFFLDMYLPDMIGVDLLKKLREKGIESPVIFSTASKDFIEQSYEADALHYLVKPITKEKIATVLGKFLNVFSKHQTVALKIGRGKENFPIANIIYIESFSHKCIVHTVKGDVEISESITDVAEKFKAYDFVKVNRTTLVNMRNITDVTSTDVILDNKVYVSISRNNKADIKTEISNFKNIK